MSEVKTLQRYRWGAQEYKSLGDLHTHLENRIGMIIDRMEITLTPKQKLSILKGIIADKDELVLLLSVNGEFEQDTWTNVFDLNAYELGR